MSAAEAQRVDYVPYNQEQTSLPRNRPDRFESDAWVENIEFVTVTAGRHAYSAEGVTENGALFLECSAWSSVWATPSGDNTTYVCTAKIKGTADTSKWRAPDYDDSRYIDQDQEEDSYNNTFTYAEYKKHTVSHTESGLQILNPWDGGTTRSLTLDDRVDVTMILHSPSLAEEVYPWAKAKADARPSNHSAYTFVDAWVTSDPTANSGG